MIHTDKPQAMLVPFSYPEYPPEIVDRFVQQSRQMLAELDIEVRMTQTVVKYEDCEAVRRAIACSEFDFLIALLPSWFEAPNLVATLRDFFHRPLLVWSHTSFVENGIIKILGALPAAGVIRETLEEMGVRFKMIFGMPGQEGIAEQIMPFARAATAVRALSRSRIGLLGYISMGMYTGSFDHIRLRARVGPEVDHLDQYVLIKKVEEMPDHRVLDLVKRAREDWTLAPDIDWADVTKAMKMYVALKDIAAERHHSVVTVKCQYELSRIYGLAPCVPISMLADELTCSCEGDVYCAVSQLLLHYVSGLVSSYGEVFHVFDDGFVTGHCGFLPLSLSMGRPELHKHSVLYEGFLNSAPYKEGRITLARLAPQGDGFKLHIASGEMKLSPRLEEVGAAPYGIGRVLMDGSVEHFLQHMGSQHYAFVYKDVRKELLEVCELLGLVAVVE